VENKNCHGVVTQPGNENGPPTVRSFELRLGKPLLSKPHLLGFEPWPSGHWWACPEPSEGNHATSFNKSEFYLTPASHAIAV